MLGQAIWCAGLILEVLLLFRGFRGKWALRYRIFYAYVLFVLSQSLLRFAVYHKDYPLYPYVYWATEFAAILIGCGLIFEVYRIGLSAYPGTARMARNLLWIIFVLAATKVLVDAWNDPHWWPLATSTDIVFPLRVVQAASIAGLVVLFGIYKIPFGKNLRGIVTGYGLFVGLNVTVFAFLSVQGERFFAFWSYAQSLAYLLVLGFWGAQLWTYQPAPEPSAPVQLEQEYQKVAAATRRRLQDVRGYVGKVMGS